MSSIQSKNHGIGTYEINKTSLSCSEINLYNQSNEYDRLALRYQT